LDRIQQYSASLRAGSKTLPQLFILLKCRLEIVTAISSGSKLPSIPKNAIMVSFAVAFIDQSDERKPIVPVISDQKLPVKKWIRKSFLLLTSNFLGAPPARESFRSSLVRRRLTFLDAAFHAALK
jgi:hypothetical protein